MKKICYVLCLLAAMMIGSSVAFSAISLPDIGVENISGSWQGKKYIIEFDKLDINDKYNVMISYPESTKGRAKNIPINRGRVVIRDQGSFRVDKKNIYLISITRKRDKATKTLMLNFKGNGVPGITLPVGSSSAALYNYIGDGKNPSLKMVLGKNGPGWGTYSIGYQGNGGIPTSTDTSKQWSSWDIKDATSNAYFGTLTLTYDGKTLKYSGYTADGTDGNYLKDIKISNSTTSNPSVSAGSVVCSYCQGANIANSVGDGVSPNVYLELGSNEANWDSYNIGFGSSGKLPVPGTWSTWNVKDAAGHYFGTINLNLVSGKVSLDSYSRPEGTEYIDDVSVSDYTVRATVHCGSPCGAFSGVPLATPPANFTLSTSGDKLLLNGITEIRLKGMARPSLEWSVTGENLSEQDFVNMHNWGSNLIRVSMNADYWNSSADETVPGSYKQTIDALVYLAAKYNMAIILDYHWSSSEAAQQNMAPKGNNNASLAFWTSVASKYKGYGHVLFELYNEPYGLSYTDWLKGNDNYYGMQDLYDTVRATGAKNVVIAGGLDYAYYLGFISSAKNCGSEDCFIKDKDQSDGYAFNIMYDSHPYNDKGEQGYTVDGAPADFATNFAGITGKYPLIWTEFGDNQSADYNGDTPHYPIVYQEKLDEINKIGINYSAWAWYISASPSFPVVIDGDWTNPTPAYGGIYVHSDLQSFPGTLLTIGQ
jgi:hypothetical protein